MAIVALTNSSSPATVERATADSDPYERETQLNGLALNFDAHDHTSAKGLGVGRVQTSSAPAAAGQVRVSGDAWQWWGATAGAVRTALDLEGAQTVSGAKTFSGAVAMTADAVVRDTLAFGEQGSAAPPDASLQRTGPRALALDAALTLSPDAGQPALHANVGAGSEGLRATFVEGAGGTFTVKYAGGIGAGYTRIDSLVGGLALAGAGGFVLPAADNTYASGHPSYRWTTLYAVAGTINTSSAQAKEAITPLDPAACAQAVLDTDWVGFDYKPPAFTEPDPQEGEAPKARSARVAEARAAFGRMLEETAPARRQRGYVLQSPEHRVSDLFGLSDRRSASPSSDLAVVAAALQHALTRLGALEAGGAA